MWRHHFEQTTDMTAEAIWPVLADVARWGKVDHKIDRIVITQPPGPGVPFTLKPREVRTLSFVIDELFEPPAIYSDVCAMPLARMTTKHELIAGATTVMKVTIEITGHWRSLGSSCRPQACGGTSRLKQPAFWMPPRAPLPNRQLVHHGWQSFYARIKAQLLEIITGRSRWSSGHDFRYRRLAGCATAPCAFILAKLSPERGGGDTVVSSRAGVCAVHTARMNTFGVSQIELFAGRRRCD